MNYSFNLTSQLTAEEDIFMKRVSPEVSMLSTRTVSSSGTSERKHMTGFIYLEIERTVREAKLRELC